MSQTNYATLNQLKDQLKINNADTSQDTYLTSLVTRCMDFIDEYTGRSFGWGDTGDAVGIDYSNSQNIAVISAIMSGNNCTIKLGGPIPWVVGSSVVLAGFTPTALNGTYTVTAVDSVNNTITVNIGSNPGNGTIMGSVQSNVVNYKKILQEQHDGLVGKTIYLRNGDIRAVSELWVGLRNTANGPVKLDATQYVWRDDGRIILGGAFFNSYDSQMFSSGGNDNAFYGSVAAGYQTILVSYFFGYIGVPAKIELACLDLCQTAYQMRQQLGLKMEQVGDYRAMYDETFRGALATQPDTLNVLNQMRRRRV
jgi:hypothetical protein